MTFFIFALSTLPGIASNSDEGRTDFPPGEYSPSLALDQYGNPFIGWEEILNNKQNDPYFARSINCGSTFLPSRVVHKDPTDQARVCVAVDSQANPHVVYVWHKPPQKFVFYSRSHDGGFTFTTPIRVDNTQCFQDRPCIALDSDDNPIVAWIEVRQPWPNLFQNPLGSISVNRSTDQGETFGQRLIVDPTSDTQGFPSIAVDKNNNPMIVFHDNRSGDFDIYFTRSDNGGQSYGVSVPVAKHPFQQIVFGRSCLAIDSKNNPVIVNSTLVDSNERWQLQLNRSTDGGKSFPLQQKLHPHNMVDKFPAIAIDSEDNLHFVCSARFVTSNLWSLFYGKLDLDDPSDPIPLSHGYKVDPSDADQIRGAIAVDSKNDPHLSWHESKYTKPMIYYSRSNNGGASLSHAIEVYR